MLICSKLAADRTVLTVMKGLSGSNADPDRPLSFFWAAIADKACTRAGRGGPAVKEKTDEEANQHNGQG